MQLMIIALHPPRQYDGGQIPAVAVGKEQKEDLGKIGNLVDRGRFCYFEGAGSVERE